MGALPATDGGGTHLGVQFLFLGRPRYRLEACHRPYQGRIEGERFAMRGSPFLESVQESGRFGALPFAHVDSGLSDDGALDGVCLLSSADSGAEV